MSRDMMSAKYGRYSVLPLQRTWHCFRSADTIPRGGGVTGQKVADWPGGGWGPPPLGIGIRLGRGISGAAGGIFFTPYFDQSFGTDGPPRGGVSSE